MKSRFRKLPFIVLFLLGFFIMIYPVISNIYYRTQASEEIASFEKAASELDKKEILRRMELAHAYNKTLDPSRLSDPFTDKEKEGRAEYARMLEVEEKIGHVEIPAIGEDLPIYAGTSDDILERGCGHLEGTSLPVGGKSTHAVITAHRGLPKAKLFRDLDKLEVGDVFYIHNIETTLAYEVDRIVTVDPSDFSEVLVTEGEDYVTLLTCTPYMINSHRLLVRGHRVPYNPEVLEKASRFNNLLNRDYKDYLSFSIPTLLVLFAIMIYLRHDVKILRKKINAFNKSDEENNIFKGGK